MIYIIKETTHVNAEREGVEFEGTLTQAKRYASRNQVFQGTVLKIETTWGELVAYKEAGKKWVNVEVF